MNNLLGNIQVLYSPWSYPPHLHWIVFFIWKQLSVLLSKSYLYGIEVDFDTSILTYEYKYHFHLVNQMYGTEVDFDTCILFLMLILHWYEVKLNHKLNNLRGNTDFLSRLNWPGTHGKYNVKFVQSQSLKSGIFFKPQPSLVFLDLFQVHFPVFFLFYLVV